MRFTIASALFACLFCFSSVEAQPKPAGGTAKNPAAPSATPTPAAPSDADLAAAKTQFAKGKELFDKKDFQGAVAAFKESYRLSKNPVLLYNIGFTLDQLGDTNMALFYYEKFVKDAPATNENIATAKTRIDVLKGGAAPSSAAPAAPGASAQPAAPSAAPVSTFEHKPIESAPPGRPIDIGAFIPAGDFQATLFFRAAGEEKFASVEMVVRYNERVGRIPASKTLAPTVQYYIEVRDASGQIAERSGKSTSPNLIFVEKDANPHYYADLGDDPSYHKDAVVTDPSQFYKRSDADADSSGRSWVDSSKPAFRVSKWTATGVAGAGIILWATFHALGQGISDDIENEANLSAGGMCPSGPPCRVFSDKQQDLETKGKRYETMAKISLGVGLVGVAAAGTLWILDWQDSRHRSSERAMRKSPRKILAAPMVSPDFIGGQASVRF